MGYPGMAPSPQGTIQEPSFVPIFSHFFSQRNQAGFGGQSQEKQFQLFKNHPLATNCLYIDGIPNDAKEREVSRIHLSLTL